MTACLPDYSTIRSALTHTHSYYTLHSFNLFILFNIYRTVVDYACLCSFKIQIFRGTKQSIHISFRKYVKQTNVYTHPHTHTHILARTHTSHRQCISIRMYAYELFAFLWSFQTQLRDKGFMQAQGEREGVRASVGMLKYYMWMALFDRIAYCFCYCW